MKIRLKVQEVATARGWDAPRLARRADLGASTVYDLFAGIPVNPGLLTLEKVAGVLGVPVTDLYVVSDGDDGAAADAPKRNMAPALVTA